LAPDYEIVGDAFAGSKDVVIAKVDADKHRELGSRFGVQGFPTLKYFPKGSTEPEEYVDCCFVFFMRSLMFCIATRVIGRSMQLSSL
jgi:hypothetical protein